MQRLIAGVFVWVGLALGCAGVRAQGATSFDVRQGLIRLDVVVTNDAGEPVPGLSAADFTLLDNGRAQKILSFASKADEPVEVIVFVDTLEMMASQATQERGEVASFLRQNGGRLAQPVLVYGLSEEGLWTVARPSQDGNELAAQIEQRKEALVTSAMPVSSGMRIDPLTRREPAGLTALRALGRIAVQERRRPGRKLLLWVGPGFGLGSGVFNKDWDLKQNIFATAAWFSTLLRDARMAIYTFSTGETDPVAARYADFLEGAKSVKTVNGMSLYKKVLAVQSGGLALDKVGDLVSQMNAAMRDASAFYTLSFDPPGTDAPFDYHDLKVEIERPGLTARTKTGYYDQPYYSDGTGVAPAAVSVEQLERTLRATHDKRDAEVAQQLAGLVLTERLSAEKLASWMQEFQGEKTRRELVALADGSAFFDPPAPEIPEDAPPDAAEQKRMIGMGVEYLRAAIPKLPNFYATRTTETYEDTPQSVRGGPETQNLALRWVRSDRAAVLYRNGREVVDSAKPRVVKNGTHSLTTEGTFGPSLSTASDIVNNANNLTWSRWRESGGHRVAVFRFSISAAGLGYHAGGCCLPDGEGTNEFRRPASYHGEVELDPASGALLRLDIEADMKSTTPVLRFDLMIEYGPVEIGGQSYISPLRSVSMSRVRTRIVSTDWDESYRTYGPYSTLLTDTTFADYHVFRAQSRILTEFQPAPEKPE